MSEDKVLKTIHRTQARIYQEHEKRGVSWSEEADLMDKAAKRIAKKYTYQIFPRAKIPCVLRDRSQKIYQVG